MMLLSLGRTAIRSSFVYGSVLGLLIGLAGVVPLQAYASPRTNIDFRSEVRSLSEAKGGVPQPGFYVSSESSSMSADLSGPIEFTDQLTAERSLADSSEAVSGSESAPQGEGRIGTRVPEPASLTLFGGTLLGLASVRCGRRRG